MIVVLTGNNEYLIGLELRKLVDDFVAMSGDSIEKFDGAEIESADAVIDAVRSISFLDPKKLVIVRDFSKNKEIIDNIESLIDQTADSTDLILLDPKLDKRTSVYKFLKANTDFVNLDTLNPHELEKWLADEAKNLQLKISKDNIRFLINRVGPNQQLLSQEIIKLSLVNGEVDKNIIENLIEPSPQSSVFDMLEALFTGNLKKAHKLYIDQRAQGEEPQKLIGMITWQLQQLASALYSPIKSVDYLVANSKISPYSARKALSLSSKMSISDIKFCIDELLQVDTLSKTSADVESALAVYFTEVSEKLK